MKHIITFQQKKKTLLFSTHKERVYKVVQPKNNILFVFAQGSR